MGYLNRENNYGGDSGSSDSYYEKRIAELHDHIAERTRIISEQKMIIQHLKDEVERLKSLKN